MRSIITIKRMDINGEHHKDLKATHHNTTRIEFYVSIKGDLEKFIISPDFDGFKIHKSYGDPINVKPCVSNEIIVS